MGRYLLVALAVVVTLYCLIDIAQVDGSRVRLMPRWLWALVVCIPYLGALLWFVLGRPTKPASGTRTRRPRAPDDDPDFLRGLK